MPKDPRSAELQIQHAQQEHEMLKRVSAILREEGYDAYNRPGYDVPRARAEMIVRLRHKLRHALGF